MWEEKDLGGQLTLVNEQRRYNEFLLALRLDCLEVDLKQLWLYFHSPCLLKCFSQLILINISQLQCKVNHILVHERNKIMIVFSWLCASIILKASL